MVNQPVPTPTPNPSPSNPGARFNIKPYVPGATTGNAKGPSQSGIIPGAGVTTNDPTRLIGDFSLTTVDPSAHFGIGDDRYNLTITSGTGVMDLPPEIMSALQAQLVRAGFTPAEYLPTGTLDDTTQSALLELKRTASASGISDMDALSTSIEMRAQAAAGKAAAKAAGKAAGVDMSPRTSTQTTTSTTNITPLDAEQIANNAYQQALGANADAKQRKALRAALQAYAGAHPSITNTTSTTDPRTNHTSTSTTSSGGVDAGGLAQIAENQAMAQPDYAEVQASGTYMNALLSALGPSTGG